MSSSKYCSIEIRAARAPAGPRGSTSARGWRVAARTRAWNWRTVLHRHAEQLADHGHRQGEGELAHDVDALAAARRARPWCRGARRTAPRHGGAAASTVLGVKARATSPRRRVWSGGLSVSIDWRRSKNSKKSATSSAGIPQRASRMPGRGVVVGALAEVRGSQHLLAVGEAGDDPAAHARSGRRARARGCGRSADRGRRGPRACQQRDELGVGVDRPRWPYPASVRAYRSSISGSGARGRASRARAARASSTLPEGLRGRAATKSTDVGHL